MKSPLLKKKAKKYKCNDSDKLNAYSVAKGDAPIGKSSNVKKINSTLVLFESVHNLLETLEWLKNINVMFQIF